MRALRRKQKPLPKTFSDKAGYVREKYGGPNGNRTRHCQKE